MTEGMVVTRTWEEQPLPVDRQGRMTETEFCRALARTLGSAFRVSLYHIEPQRLVERCGAGPRARGAVDVPALLSETANGGTVLNRAVGRSRVSVLPFPSARGAPRLALVLEADSGAFGRAAALLAALADPDSGPGRPAAAAHVGDTLERLLEEVEARIGVPVPDMSRTQKQEVVKYLDERGAFLLKKAVEQVASRLGVSRFTIYNYLDEVKRAEEGGPWTSP